jgi:hypothetical protein
VNKPKPTTRCRACKKRYENHIDRRCPDGSGIFVSRSLKRSSASFSESEVLWMDTVLHMLLRGGTPAPTMARSPECKTIAAKLAVMKSGIERNKYLVAHAREAK